MTQMRSMKASLFLLDLKLCHSASFECARTMPGEGDRPDILGADIIAFLGRRQQRVQHLDRRLEHLDEFEDALVGAIETAGIAVGIGIVLGVGLQFANVYLADQRGDVLVILVARFGLRNRDLPQARWLDLGDTEA